MDRQYLAPRRPLAAAYLQARQFGEAVRTLEGGLGDAEHDPTALAGLAQGRGVAAERAAAAGLLMRVERLARQRYVPAYHRALAYVGLSDTDAAFGELAQVADDSDPA